MAGTFTAVDLSQLPAPVVVEQLDFETIFSDMLADLIARDPTFDALVESDPAYKILEVCAYRELLVRQRANDAALGTMLAYAKGTDLDQIAGNYDVKRLLIQAEDLDSIPPVPAVYESDEELRRRVQLSLEGYTTAGSVGAYLFHALSASGDILDVAVTSLTPGTVNVAILSRTGTGAAPQETLNAVVSALNAEEVRPLCDTVAVQSAQIVNYSIVAVLTTYPGTGQTQVLAAASAAASAYAARMHKLGLDITRAGCIAALMQPGVQNVALTSPAADLPIAWNQASNCTGATISIGGSNE